MTTWVWCAAPAKVCLCGVHCLSCSKHLQCCACGSVSTCVCRTLLEFGTFGRMPCLGASSSRQRFGASCVILASATEIGVHCLSWVALGLLIGLQSCLAIRASVWSLGWAHGMGVCMAAALLWAEIYLTGAEAGACAPLPHQWKILQPKSVRPCRMESGVHYRYSEG